MQGLAPYWIRTEATVYAGTRGRTAARLRAETDVLLSQRLILQPELELDACGKSDPARELRSGLATLDLALRLRYELRRELAPYIGIDWLPRISGAMSHVAAAPMRELRWVIGVHAWL